MEVLELAGPGAGTLGEDAHAADAPLEIVRRLENGLQGLPVVLPVDGQKARRVGDISHHGDLEIGGLGHKGDVIVAQFLQDDQRVKEAPVIAHQQKGRVRQLFFSGDLGPYAAVGADQLSRVPCADAAHRQLFFQGRLPISAPQAEDPVGNDKQQMQHELQPDEDRDGPPERKAAAQRQRDGPRQTQQKHTQCPDHTDPTFLFW